MIRDGVRRCDLCASEILGTKGADICFICGLCIDEARDNFMDDRVRNRQQRRGYGSSASVLPQSLPRPQAATVASNDDSTARPWHLFGRKVHGRGADVLFRSRR